MRGAKGTVLSVPLYLPLLILEIFKKGTDRTVPFAPLTNTVSS